MATKAATINMPIYARFGGQEVELGTLAIDVKVSQSGKIYRPKPDDIKRALRKGLR